MPVGLTAMGSKIELEGTKMLTSRGVERLRER
jgi:UDP-N-acetylglucosamine enolpyruvyl transferase